MRNNNDFDFQWLGNPLYEYRKPFLPGWYNPNDSLNRGYYARAKQHKSHYMWDSVLTETKKLRLYDLWYKGRNAIDDRGLLTAEAKDAIKKLVTEVAPKFPFE